MQKTRKRRTNWQRTLLIIVALTILLSLVLSACAPALDQPARMFFSLLLRPIVCPAIPGREA